MFSQTHQALVDIIKTIRLNYDIPIAIGGVHVTGSISDETTSKKFLSDVSGVKFNFFK